MRTSIFSLMIIGITMFGMACTPETSEGLFPPQDTGAEVADAILDMNTGDGVPQVPSSTLTGYWAKLDQSSTCVKVLTATVESFSYNLALFIIRELWRSDDGTRAWVEITAPVCRKTMTPIVLGLAANVPNQVVDTMVPPVFLCLVQAPAGKSIPAEGEFSLEGLTFSCPSWVELLGVHLTDPMFEELPADPEDPRVFDQDSDGKPGVTMVLGDGMCDILVVSRSIGMFEGQFQSPNLLVSMFESEVAQKVLKGTEGLCGTENETTSNPPRSKVYMMRLDGHDGAFNADANQDGVITCEDLRSRADALYQEYGVVQDKPDNAKCPK